MVGAAPGTLVIDSDAHKPLVSVISYSPGGLDEHPEIALIDLPGLLDNQRAITWVNVTGLGDEMTLRAIGDLFQIHPLALEDVVNVFQRAKAERYGDDLFIVARMAMSGERVETEQMSMFVRDGLVLTFQESPGDPFDQVRERIRHGRGRIRGEPSAYLAYALLDALIDAYFPILESYEGRLDDLEVKVLGESSGAVLNEIHGIRRSLLKFHRLLWPHAEMFHSLIRDPEMRLPKAVHVFMRDMVDHAQRLLDMVETDRDFAATLMEVYISHVGHRSNEVMKVLTIIATIFMPLSFIAGVYGMNFDTGSPLNMPELSWKLGYLMVLGVMGTAAIGMLWFFRRRDWL